MNNQYDEEPVCYCKKCLSLRVMRLLDGADFCYCDKCGSTDIAETDIHSWENLYKERYGKSF